MSFDAPAKTNPCEYPHAPYFSRNYSHRPTFFAADSMGLSSFKCVQWAPKDASILQQRAGRKRILTSNSHSRSFATCSYRPTMGSISPYNTVGLVSEDSEEVATQIAKNVVVNPTHLMPPPRGTPANILIHLTLLLSM